MTPQYTPEALRDLAAFLPIFEASDFRFARNDSPLRQTGEKSYEMVGYDYDPQVWKLLEVLDRHGWVHNDERFRWMEWVDTEEAARLLSGTDALAHATPEQLARLLTVFARQERFSDGAMLSFYESGLLLGSLKRVHVLAGDAERTSA